MTVQDLIAELQRPSVDQLAETNITQIRTAISHFSGHRFVSLSTDSNRSTPRMLKPWDRVEPNLNSILGPNQRI